MDDNTEDESEEAKNKMQEMILARKSIYGQDYNSSEYQKIIQKKRPKQSLFAQKNGLYILFICVWKYINFYLLSKKNMGEKFCTLF